MNTIYFAVNGESMSTNVKEAVPFSTLLQAITDGVSICYDDEGAYHAELLDFAIEYMCLKTLTDLELGETTNEAWPYIRAIDGVPSVDADFIADGIRSAVQHRNRLIIASMQSYGANQLADRIDAVVSGFENLSAAAVKLISALADSAEKNKDVDFNGLLDALSNGKFSEQSLVGAVLNYQAAKDEKEKTTKKSSAKKRTPKKAVAVKE